MKRRRHELWATGGFKGQVVMYGGALRETPLFISERLLADDDDDGNVKLKVTIVPKKCMSRAF